jgi:hypothetical protein
MDHVYPYAKGGETTFGNLVTACARCNSHKNAKVGMWPNSLEVRENKNNLIAFVFFMVGLGIFTTPFSGYTPSDISIYFYSIGAILFLAGIYSVSKSL